MIQPQVEPSDCAAALEFAIELGALQTGEFTLSSGGKSTYYFDGRLVSLDSEGVCHLGEVVLDLARKFQAQAVGGPTLGADPIVGATLALAGAQGIPLKGFLVRSAAKGHGTQKEVEGPLQAGMSVIMLDDTCSTGGALFHAIEAVEALGCKVILVFTVLDRHQGGSDELRRRGYQFVALLEADAQGNIKPAG